MTEFKSVFRQEGYSEMFGEQGIQILLGGIDPETLTEDEKWMFCRAGEKMLADLRMSIVQRDPVQIGKRAATIGRLMACFPIPIPVNCVEELPNEYCSQACCWSSPWLLVTTSKGHIKIGWRKRVISVDWSATDDTFRASTLFPNEDVTKDSYLIHAWGYEKAKEYLAKILA